jgi:hypothetical protein
MQNPHGIYYIFVQKLPPLLLRARAVSRPRDPDPTLAAAYLEQWIILKVITFMKQLLYYHCSLKPQSLPNSLKNSNKISLPSSNYESLAQEQQ